MPSAYSFPFTNSFSLFKQESNFVVCRNGLVVFKLVRLALSQKKRIREVWRHGIPSFQYRIFFRRMAWATNRPRNFAKRHPDLINPIAFCRDDAFTDQPSRFLGVAIVEPLFGMKLGSSKVRIYLLLMVHEVIGFMYPYGIHTYPHSTFARQQHILPSCFSHRNPAQDEVVTNSYIDRFECMTYRTAPNLYVHTYVYMSSYLACDYVLM